MTAVRWWRRAGPGDAAQARLLLRRAAGPGRVDDLREARRLMRRVCRPWRGPSAADRDLLRDVEAEYAAVLGAAEQNRTWRDAATQGDRAEQIERAAAWAAWAETTGLPGYAAEAHVALHQLTGRDPATAALWLARSGRMRDAVRLLNPGYDGTGRTVVHLNAEFDLVAEPGAEPDLVRLPSAPVRKDARPRTEPIPRPR